ncbi:Putative TrmH family tRNA/rRNA methyltransferase [Arcanobacterium haemolyticum]|uniref:TrmH family RNA methyltransferase n=1 Tax=Arcanobacterium haemolyticum TaxID=28264 RepID=UPI000D9601F6|nr:RNA methyltransferase [Arcanobacterium haemolyticum]SPT74801.1 Putative TrmH family tRNA/rRNA methyltransferase [Arcanobacterium haemolyticum]
MPRTPMMTMTGQLKKATGLYRRKMRVQYEQAIVEGPQGVREALLCHERGIRDVYVTQEALERHPDIDALLRRVDPYTHILPSELCSSIAPNSQGIFAVIAIPDEEDIRDIFAHGKLVVCALESVDPGNVGTIIRCADACGADAVILGRGSVEATNPKVMRSSAGSYFHIPILEDEDVADVVAHAREAGFQILIADGRGEYDLGQLADQALLESEGAQGGADAQAGGAESAAEQGNAAIDLRRPTLWLVGNEAHGFTDEQYGYADGLVRIPMWGASESLNVAMATSICLFSSARAQHRG